MESYSESLDKVALAVESAKIAKALMVQQEGVGEDLNFNLMAWRDDQLVAVAQLSQVHMKDHEDRYDRMVKAACILRKGWGATSLTMVAEGYCSTNPEESRGKNMAQLFAMPEADYIKECLSFTHVHDEGILFVVVPYRYRPPRKVMFYSALTHAGSGVVRESRYPLSFHMALGLPYDVEDDDLDEDAFRAELAVGLKEIGFEVNYR